MITNNLFLSAHELGVQNYSVFFILSESLISKPSVKDDQEEEEESDSSFSLSSCMDSTQMRQMELTSFQLRGQVNARLQSIVASRRNC